MSLLRVRGLARAPHFAARDLELASGEILFLSGASGSGKSLYLRTIADLDPTSDGKEQVELEGTDRRSLPANEWRRRVLYLAQTPARTSGTIGEDLAAIAAIGGEPATSLESLLEELDLGAEQRVEKLSGGELQLLALARAFLHPPRVLLLDEATAHLDAERSETAEAALRRRATDGLALLWISHDAGLIERMGSRVERFP